MKRYCLTLNLKNDPELIRQYEEHHKAVWPEIVRSIRESGINNMQIYRYGVRLFMIMEVNDDFNFETKQQLDNNNPRVEQWETLMLNYQQPFAEADPGVKWVLMDKIFELSDF